ncbi:MAG: hypothetical protein K8S14_03820, partial [Actinomycetia bacterium]|nr:hypothetical protein [Actinomycetes bacterium]
KNLKTNINILGEDSMAIQNHIIAFILSLAASHYLFHGDANTTVGLGIVFFCIYLIGASKMKK